MKLKIKIRLFNKECMPQIISKGDWIDLKIFESFSINKVKAPVYQMLSLGVAMQLPDGYEAIIVPRSSTFKKYGIMLANSVGIIDNTYCGNGDMWCFPALIFKDTTIPSFERICQFRIQLSQKATVWQKIKNLFYSGVKFEVVDNLVNPNRGGFGSTGR